MTSTLSGRSAGEMAYEPPFPFTMTRTSPSTRVDLSWTAMAVMPLSGAPLRSV